MKEQKEQKEQKRIPVDDITFEEEEYCIIFDSKTIRNHIDKKHPELRPYLVGYLTKLNGETYSEKDIQDYILHLKQLYNDGYFDNMYKCRDEYGALSIEERDLKIKKEIEAQLDKDFPDTEPHEVMFFSDGLNTFEEVIKKFNDSYKKKDNK